MTNRTHALLAAAILAAATSSTALAAEPDINWSNFPGSKCVKALASGTLRVSGARAENTHLLSSLRVSCDVERQNVLGELGSGSHVWVIDDHATLPVTCDLVVRDANGDAERSRQTRSTSAGQDSRSPVRLSFGAAAASTNDIYVISCLIPPGSGGVSSVVGARVVEVEEAEPRICPTSYVPPVTLPGVDPIPLLAGAPSNCSVASNNAPCAPHHIYTPSPVRERSPLFVFLPGTNMAPDKHDEVLMTAASTGYRAIGLSYDNTTAGNVACPRATTPCGGDCNGNYRNEIVTGNNTSSAIAVSSGDAILERLYRLLVHLDTTNPGGGWSTYYTPTPGAVGYDNIAWQNIILGGFSQGAGHAAFISKTQAVHGLFILDGSNDTCIDPASSTSAPADWMSTPDASAGRPKFGVRHDHGTGAVVNTDTWQALGLGASLFDIDCTGGFPCGAPGVLDSDPPPQATKTDHVEASTPALCTAHRSMARDRCMPTTLTGASTGTMPDDYRLFEPYALRLCHACDTATCP